MPAMALGTTTIENIVAHDAAALEKDLASVKLDSALTLPGVPIHPMSCSYFRLSPERSWESDICSMHRRC